MMSFAPVLVMVRTLHLGSTKVFIGVAVNVKSCAVVVTVMLYLLWLALSPEYAFMSAAVRARALPVALPQVAALLG
jgi:hypothetical protein